MDHSYGGHSYPSQQQQQQYAAPPSALPYGGPPGMPPLPGPQTFFPPPLPYPYPSMPYTHALPPPGPPMPHIPQQPPPAPMPQPGCGFFNPWEPPPPVMPPPSDPELQKCIEKLVEYAAKNGPEFVKMLKEKQKDNPAYAFLFGAEGYGYYRYKLWITLNPHLAGGGYMASLPSAPPPLPALSPTMAPLNPAITSLSHSLAHMSPASLNNSMHSVSMPPATMVPQFYEQHQHLQQPPLSQPYLDHTYETGSKPFKGLSGPLPADVAAELKNVIDNLTGTKESIKGAKNWFMQRSPFAPALAEALRERVLFLEDDAKQLHVIYLANDILFESLQRRMVSNDLDNESSVFQPVLGSMLAAIYHNPSNREANQTRLRKILQFWASKDVYSADIIAALESEMIAGPALAYRIPSSVAIQSESIPAPAPSTTPATMVPLESAVGEEHASVMSSPEAVQSIRSPSSKEEKLSLAALVAAAQYGTAATSATTTSGPVNSAPVSGFSSVSPVLPSTLAPAGTASVAQHSSLATIIEPPPYPLFPPGLIPGMVRKMQIGSGVPYSALSPLDIPAVIPPSTVSDLYILDRVAKFFREIGEIDPLKNHVKGSSGSTRDDDDDIEERERRRTGGACIPPPPTLQIDPETNILPDGSMEHKPGSVGTTRLGLGAVADPNEITQYDDVYTSYRKQRSTSYHTFMSARAGAR